MYDVDDFVSRASSYFEHRFYFGKGILTRRRGESREYIYIYIHGKLPEEKIKRKTRSFGSFTSATGRFAISIHALFPPACDS